MKNTATKSRVHSRLIDLLFEFDQETEEYRNCMPNDTERLDEYEVYRSPFYKPFLIVRETDYTHWSAWAHTIPMERQKRDICIRPRERRDYRIVPLDILVGHEIGHNVRHLFGLPDNDEDSLTRNAHTYLKSGLFDVKYSMN